MRFRTYKGSKGKSKYNKNEVDLFAFVDIDTKSIAWVHFDETYQTGLGIKKKILSIIILIEHYLYIFQIKKRRVICIQDGNTIKKMR